MHQSTRASGRIAPHKSGQCDERPLTMHLPTSTRSIPFNAVPWQSTKPNPHRPLCCLWCIALCLVAGTCWPPTSSWLTTVHVHFAPSTRQAAAWQQVRDAAVTAPAGPFCGHTRHCSTGSHTGRQQRSPQLRGPHAPPSLPRIPASIRGVAVTAHAPHVAAAACEGTWQRIAAASAEARGEHGSASCRRPAYRWGYMRLVHWAMWGLGALCGLGSAIMAIHVRRRPRPNMLRPGPVSGAGAATAAGAGGGCAARHPQGDGHPTWVALATAAAADHYGALGLAPTATSEEIKRAYRREAKAKHPDVNAHAQAQAEFRAVAEAYRVLSSPAERRLYDAERVARAPPPPAAGAPQRAWPRAPRRSDGEWDRGSAWGWGEPEAGETPGRRGRDSEWLRQWAWKRAEPRHTGPQGAEAYAGGGREDWAECYAPFQRPPVEAFEDVDEVYEGYEGYGGYDDGPRHDAEPRWDPRMGDGYFFGVEFGAVGAGHEHGTPYDGSTRAKQLLEAELRKARCGGGWVDESAREQPQRGWGGLGCADDDADREFSRFGHDDADREFSRFGHDDADREFSRFGHDDADREFSRFGHDDADRDFSRFLHDVVDGDFPRFSRRRKRRRRPKGPGPGSLKLCRALGMGVRVQVWSRSGESQGIRVAVLYHERVLHEVAVRRRGSIQRISTEVSTAVDRAVERYTPRGRCGRCDAPMFADACGQTYCALGCTPTTSGHAADWELVFEEDEGLGSWQS